jgi:anaerobic selenocysteine-containing dehydrogenase
MQKPAAEPLGECRFFLDVILDLLDRIGLREKYNAMLNSYYSIEDDELRIQPGEKLNWSQIGERVLKWVYGADSEKIREQGYATWHKPIEDVYWRWHMDCRVPTYMEFLIEAREEVEKICREKDIDLDWEQYTPLPSWFYPTSYTELDDEYDMIGFSYRDILHTNNTTYQNPLIDEVSQLCPYTYTITMNTDVALQRGLQDGDAIWLENRYGIREKGVLKCMQGQHPRTLGIAGQGGLWAEGRPIAKGRGSNFCKLLPTYLRHYDPVTGNIETSVALKVRKAV